ncbi:dynein regulatory complex protein 1-like [Metopolophium dirhodum]|uniref:dynein regulatory complex protein 1-like n=1 Tax=Metopolophium dirhodum TaxID=44670 RepID=UPI00298F83D7|nr:dynein regulatory complex protein 1-like [Metopolophium dirhodum]
MENEEYEAITFHNVPVENLIDSRKYCDRRKIFENRDNFIFDGIVHGKTSRNNIEAEREKNEIEDSDENLVVLEKEERKVLRKCNIWRRQNIDCIENAVAKRKFQQKMIIQPPVVKKIENSEFELSNLIEELNNFIEGKCLIFHTNEYEREWIDKNVNQDRLSEVKNTLIEINKKCMDIDDKFKITSNKEDILVIQEDIVSLKKESLDLLKQKDKIIDKLLEGLEELLTKSFNETTSNTNDLDKLNEIANNKLHILKEEHKKYYLAITKLIEDTKNEKNNNDSAKWRLLMNKIINKISRAALKRLVLIENNNLELLKQFKTNEENAKIFRLETTENYIGVDTDLEFVKIRCSTNIKKLKYNCHVLKKKIEDNNFRIVNQKRRINFLQEIVYTLREKCNKIESDVTTQKSTIEKQIININKKIDQQEKRADSVAKKDNDEYVQLWDLQLTDIINYINSVRQTDNFIREYFSFSGQTNFCDKLTIDDDDTIVPLLKHINNLILYEPVYNSLNTNYYEHIRDKALNNLLLDFIVRNSSFVFDHNLNGILDTNSMQNLSYAYNAFSDLKLNKEESWDLIKSKFKPFVNCIDCNSQINWESGEIIGTSGSEQKICNNNTISDNCINEQKLSKYLYFEKLCRNITQHNKNIDKLKKSDPLHQFINDTACSNNITFENIDEEQNNKYSTILVKENTSLNNTRCGNLNHKLSIDNKHFMHIMKEIIKESQSTRFSKPKSLYQRLKKEYNFVQWIISENDLQEYWSQLVKYIPSSVDSWKMYYEELGHYYRILVVRQKKMVKAKTLQAENTKLKKVIHELEL